MSSFPYIKIVNNTGIGKDTDIYFVDDNGKEISLNNVLSKVTIEIDCHGLVYVKMHAVAKVETISNYVELINNKRDKTDA